MAVSARGIQPKDGGSGAVAIGLTSRRRLAALVADVLDLDVKAVEKGKKGLAELMYDQARDDPTTWLERVGKYLGADDPTPAGQGLSLNIRELHLAAVRGVAEPTTLDVTPDRGTIGVQPNASDW